MHEGTQVNHVALSGLVADALRLGGIAGAEFFEGEVLRDFYCHTRIFYFASD